MIESQKLQVRMSEVRQKLNELAGDENADGAEVDKLVAEMGTLESRYRAAVTVEDHADAEAEAAKAAKTPETRELAELRGRVELRDYLLEAAKGRAATGAAHEFRAAIMGDAAREGVIPWEALLPVEERADAATVGPTTIQGNQQPIMARVFAASAAAFLGVAMPSVPVGQTIYPIMSGGATAAMRAAGAAKDAEPATFTVETLEPVRLSARYLFRVEDLAKLKGMEDALRADLRAAMSDAMDKQVLSGDGTAPNQSGFLTTLTAPSDPTGTAATFADFLAAHVAGVDGLYASGLQGVRMLVGVESYKIAAAAFNTSGDTASSDYLTVHSGGLRTSANIPAAASTIQNAITYAAGGAGSAVAPVWQGLEMIRDPYTSAASGEIALTAVALWAFKILRTAPYTFQKFKVA